jgi:hypothetical protein
LPHRGIRSRSRCSRTPEHGIYEYEITADGKRLSTRNPDGYFAMMRNFILHERLIEQHYGTSTVFMPAAVKAGAARAIEAGSRTDHARGA